MILLKPEYLDLLETLGVTPLLPAPWSIMFLEEPSAPILFLLSHASSVEALRHCSWTEETLIIMGSQQQNFKMTE